MTAATPAPTIDAALAKSFDQWTLNDAKAAVEYALTSTIGRDAYAANKALAETGDHWNDGKGIPQAGDPAVRAATLTRLKAEQAPTDTANEILDNATNGLLGTEAAVTFVPLKPTDDKTKQAENEKIAKAMTEALSAWWDRVDLWALARVTARRSRWAGRSPLRVWLPASSLVQPSNEGGDTTPDSRTPKNLAFADALAKLAVSAPAPDQAHLFVHPDTLATAAIFLFQREGREAAELWFVDAAGRTVRKDLTTGAAAGTAGTDPLSLEGRLPISEVSARVLLTESVRHQQAALDFDGIAGRTAIKAAGFRARYTLNAQPTGIWTTTKPTESLPLKEREWDGKTWYLVETPLLMGPNINNQLTGEEVEDSTTNNAGDVTTRRTLKDPGVYVEEPVDPAFFITAAEFRRATMLRDAKQGHLALVAKGEASGTAYVQARAAFKQDLENARGPLERALRDVIAYAIAFADLMTVDGDPLKGFLTKFRVQVTARVDAGPLTPEERAEYLAEWTAGAISRDTLMAWLGIEDIGAEQQALERDPMVRLTFLAKLAETMTALAGVPGGSIDSAARALKEVGIEPKLVEAVMPRDTDGTATADVPNDPVAAAA